MGRAPGAVLCSALFLAAGHARGAENRPEAGLQTESDARTRTESDPALPSGPPPELVGSRHGPAPGQAGSDAPGWNEEDRPTYHSENAEASRPRARRSIGFHAWVGGHTLLAQDKVMPGLNARFGARPVWLDLEGSFVWVTRRARELDSSFLGNHLAAYLMFTTFRQKWFETRLGLGGDFFPLSNISANEWHRALSARTTAQIRLWPRIEAFGTARVFLLHDDGLELGTTRNGRSGFPVLFSFGLAWRTE